jgi:hypothetical protein
MIHIQFIFPSSRLETSSLTFLGAVGGIKKNLLTVCLFVRKEKLGIRFDIHCELESKLFDMKAFTLTRGTAALILALKNVELASAYKRTSGARIRGRTLAVGQNPSSSKGKGKNKNKGESDDDDDDEDDDNIFNHNTRTEIESEDAFVAYCRSSLLSFGAASDGLISQVDVAEFVWDVCEVFDHESIPEFRCPTPQFANLDIEIQLSFVWYICPNDDQVSTLTCLGNLGLEQTEFGYPITAADYQTGAESVLGFCCSLLPFLDRTEITPTSSSICPTSLPVIDLSTPAPVPQPTMRPTRQPVPSPTPVPVPDATVRPTPSPTLVDNNISGSSPAPQPENSTPTPTQGEQPVILVRGTGGEQVEPPNTLSVGGTVGIVLGSAAFLMAFALIFTRRRQKAEAY